MLEGASFELCWKTLERYLDYKVQLFLKGGVNLISLEEAGKKAETQYLAPVCRVKLNGKDSDAGGGGRRGASTDEDGITGNGR